MKDKTLIGVEALREFVDLSCSDGGAGQRKTSDDQTSCVMHSIFARLMYFYKFLQ